MYIAFVTQLPSMYLYVWTYNTYSFPEEAGQLILRETSMLNTHMLQSCFARRQAWYDVLNTHMLQSCFAGGRCYDVNSETFIDECVECWEAHTNDPSAGSPTETLLRLLLPLSDKVYTTLCCRVWMSTNETIWIIYRITRSVGATGGVYKGQGRNQHELMTRTY